MIKTHTTGGMKTLFYSAVILTAFLLSSCTWWNTQSSNQAQADEPSPKNAPYYPTGVNDIQMPGELSLKRDESMYINTASFAGGIMVFEGRVEINSLTDFFIATMGKNDWKLAGSIRYANALLAFVKSNKTCLISIKEGNMAIKTQVYVYITEDIMSKGSGYSNSSLSEERIR